MKDLMFILSWVTLGGWVKKIITTARDDTKLHFDVKDWTFTFYNDSRTLENHLKNRFSFELGFI